MKPYGASCALIFLALALCAQSTGAANASDGIQNYNTKNRTNGQYCPGRGGCTCDCSWANPSTCGNDDGSCCFACCCSSNPPPPPPPNPGPPPSGNRYCPGTSDLVVAYGFPQIFNQGWSIQGGGAVATAASYNVLGGSIEWDVDFSATNIGVNANVYSISPSFWGSFNQNDYCDGQKYGSAWCLEVDYIESNGRCGGATTLHSVQGGGAGCNTGGCQAQYLYNGRSSFHMKVTFGLDGTWITYRDGTVISGWNMQPLPSSSDWATLAQYYSTRGAVVYSSQWQGWVPEQGCGTSGDLGSSYFKVSNLVITGSVVSGPTPPSC